MVEAVQEYKPGRPLSLVGCIRFVVNPIETKPILGQHRRLSSVLRPSRNDLPPVHPVPDRQIVRREMEIEPIEMAQRQELLFHSQEIASVPKKMNLRQYRSRVITRCWRLQQAQSLILSWLLVRCSRGLHRHLKT